MGVIKGQNLRLKIGDKFVAYATSCTLHISTTLEESSTKDSTNDFQEQEATGTAWDVSTDALYTVSTDAGAMNGENMLDLFIDPAKRRVQVSFLGTAAGSEKNRGTQAGTVFSGYAWVSDISINATNRQNATYTIQLTGDGPLSTGSSNANQGIFDSTSDV
jgi:predicted secreted protein